MAREMLIVLFTCAAYAISGESSEFNFNSTEDTLTGDITLDLQKNDNIEHRSSINTTNFAQAFEKNNQTDLLSNMHQKLLKNSQYTGSTVMDISKNNCARLVRHARGLDVTELYYESWTCEKLLAANCHINRPILRALPNLEVLDLSYNRITFVWRGCFENNIKLRFLDLSFNAIEYIEPLSFPSNAKLEVLNLAMNKLIDLKEITNDGLPELKLLNMSYNFIDAIDDTVELPKTTNLDLSFNEITIFPEEIDHSFPNLEILNLSENPLFIFRRIRSRSLTDLSLSKCKLKTIEDKAFVEAPKLTFLDVSSNKLKTFEFLKFIDYTAAVELSSNLWECNCEVKISLGLYNDLQCEPEKVSLAEFCGKSSGISGSGDNSAWITTCIIFILLFIASIAGMTVYFVRRRNRRKNEQNLKSWGRTGDKILKRWWTADGEKGNLEKIGKAGDKMLQRLRSPEK